ncbi:hypothetical protein [uncultured Dokdonia sp.]|nr:hypothetical protein [uncultured Dokdonia sp.]
MTYLITSTISFLGPIIGSTFVSLGMGLTLFFFVAAFFLLFSSKSNDH